MNFSCPMVAFDQEFNHIPWTIFKSKLSFQTTVDAPWDKTSYITSFETSQTWSGTLNYAWA